MYRLWSLLVVLSVTVSGATATAAPDDQPDPDGAWRIGWPCWSGPHTNFSGVLSGARLVDDLRDARLLWKSEETIPVGKAHNPGSSSRGARGKPTGGGASPIVADGLVYLWYYRPCGDVVDQERFQGAKENARYGGPDADPMTWRTGADEVVVAMDAETGKTVWKKVFVDEGINIQSGKDAGISNHTMCYADGRVYALGTMGRVYCQVAKTGELIWRGTNGATEELEAKKEAALKAGKMADKRSHSHEHGRGTSGLIVAGSVLIVPMGTHGGGGLRGLDGVTGKVLWQLNESVRGSAATPSRWVHDGREYVIVANVQGQIACIDPVGGKVVWRVEDAGANFSSLAVGGDYLIAKPQKETVTDPATGEKKESVDGPLGCYRLSLEGGELVWKLPFGDYQWNEQPPAITNGHVYARVKSDVGEAKPGNARGVCIELSTGRVKGEFNAPFGGADCCTIVADARVLADADGSHNDTQLYLADADPAEIKSLGGSVPWRPPHVTTTAYHPAVTHAYVAGRVFIRGQNHICCYDVRRDPP